MDELTAIRAKLKLASYMEALLDQPIFGEVTDEYAAQVQAELNDWVRQRMAELTGVRAKHNANFEDSEVEILKSLAQGLGPDGVLALVTMAAKINGVAQSAAVQPVAPPTPVVKAVSIPRVSTQPVVIDSPPPPQVVEMTDDLSAEGFMGPHPGLLDEDNDDLKPTPPAPALSSKPKVRKVKLPNQLTEKKNKKATRKEPKSIDDPLAAGKALLAKNKGEESPEEYAASTSGSEQPERRFPPMKNQLKPSENPALPQPIPMTHPSHGYGSFPSVVSPSSISGTDITPL